MTQWNDESTAVDTEEPTFVPTETEEVPVEDVDLDVDSTVGEDDEVEDVPATAEGEEKAEKPKKEKAAPKRGELPEGYTTPVGLAKIITERGLYTNRDGEVAELKPQMVYSYAKNAPKDNPFPSETITDSVGAERNAVKIEAGVEWWVNKNARAAERRENAAEKAKKAEENKAKKAAAATTEEAEGTEAHADETGPAEEAE